MDNIQSPRNKIQTITNNQYPITKSFGYLNLVIGYRLVIVTCVLVIFNFAFCINSFSQEWQELKGEHFIIYHGKGIEVFAKEISFKAEKYYISIAKDLGYQRYSKFWLWDNRVKIYIYSDQTAYLKDNNIPQWSHGFADYQLKLIKSYDRGKGFAESILPHEIAHLLFRDFIGFKGKVPLWLDEGVAQWAEIAKRDYFKQLMKKAFLEKKVLSLKHMMTIDISRIKTDDKVYVRYSIFNEDPIILIISGENLINLYYLEAVSLVGFLIEQYGATKFTAFCRELREGKPVEEALRAAYPFSIKSFIDLERNWTEYMQKQ